MIQRNLDDFLAKSDIVLVDAMRMIDKNAKGILFITDQTRHLLGSLTDGDIRRCIIKTGDLQKKASDAMMTNTKYFTLQTTEDPYAYMEAHKIHALPLLDGEGRILDITFLDDDGAKRGNDLKGSTVVIMAGGKGTRLYPYTRILPKALIPIKEKTISEHIIDSFSSFGCEDFCFVLNYKKNMIKAYFNEQPHKCRISYVEEERPLGTGGGIRLLKGMINDTFILTNCDILIRDDISRIYRHHKEHGNEITMVCSMKEYVLPYGVVHTGVGGSIQSMEEKPRMSYLVNTGCYVVEPGVIDAIPEDTEIGFPDIIEQYRKAGKKVGIYPISEGAWMDMGEMDLLEKALI